MNDPARGSTGDSQTEKRFDEIFRALTNKRTVNQYGTAEQFPDGLMLCRFNHKENVGSGTWQYPVAFIAAPGVYASAPLTFGTPTESRVTFTKTPTSAVVDFLAIGYWK
jgi:hypothetical protein